MARLYSNKWHLAIVGTAILFVLILADILVGGNILSFSETLNAVFGCFSNDTITDRQVVASNIVWSIRGPRVLTAVLTGAILALSGIQMQAVFRNPLADPHIMGVSAGAGTGAAIAAISLPALSFSGAIMTGITMASAAFAGAIISSLIIIYISGKVKGAGVLLIAGVLLGFIFSAITSIIEYSANEETLKLFYSWAAGNFSKAGYSEILLLAVALLVGITLYIVNVRGLDIVLFGDEFAEASGASVNRIRLLAMLGCCIMTGTVTAFCGPIGFLGIVAPHISRAVCKSSVHKNLLIMTMITGASIAVAGDIVAQSFGFVLPVGSTIALIGIPMIAIILLKRNSMPI